MNRWVAGAVALVTALSLSGCNDEKADDSGGSAKPSMTRSSADRTDASSPAGASGSSSSSSSSAGSRSSSSTSSQPADGPATQRDYINPVTSSGAPRPGWAVKSETDYQCDMVDASLVAVSPSIYQCGPNAAYLVACWPTGEGHSYCARSPYEKTIWKVDGEAGPQSTQRTEPFGLRLANGTTCEVFIGGAGRATGHGLIAYGCEDGNQVYVPVDGPWFDRSKPRWTAPVAKEAAAPRPMAIVSVVYARATPLKARSGDEPITESDVRTTADRLLKAAGRGETTQQLRRYAVPAVAGDLAFKNTPEDDGGPMEYGACERIPGEPGDTCNFAISAPAPDGSSDMQYVGEYQLTVGSVDGHLTVTKITYVGD